MYAFVYVYSRYKYFVWSASDIRLIPFFLALRNQQGATREAISVNVS